MARRVIFLITDLDLGGCPLLLLRLVRDMKARGRFAPLVASIKSAGPVGRGICAAGVDVVSLHAAGPRDFNAFNRWIGLLHSQRPAAVVSLLIHANLLATAAATAAPPCPYLHTLHTLQDRPRWHWPLSGFIAGRSAGVAAPSRAILNRLTLEGYCGPCYTAPNGIDVEKFLNAVPPEPSQLPWPPGSTVVGYVGRFDPVKRLDALVRGFARLLLSDYHRWERLQLVLIGYGPMEGPLRKLAAELGVSSHIYFPGPTAAPEIWYKTLDVFINPCDVEGFGLSVVEAMAAGVPVMARSGGAMDEIITHDASGWLYGPDELSGRAKGAGRGTIRLRFASPDAEADAIARALRTLLSDAALRGRLAMGGVNRVVGRYTTAKMVLKYEEILEKIIG